VTCPYCSLGNVSVEILGFAIHKLSDRWITCNAKPPSTLFSAGAMDTRDEKFPTSMPLATTRTATSAPEFRRTGTYSR
jgi:hypothetical protein